MHAYTVSSAHAYSHALHAHLDRFGVLRDGLGGGKPAYKIIHCACVHGFFCACVLPLYAHLDRSGVLRDGLGGGERAVADGGPVLPRPDCGHHPPP